MKVQIILLLLGTAASVIGNPVSKEATSSQNEKSLLPVIESEVKREEDIALNEREAQANELDTRQDLKDAPATEETIKYGSGDVDIVIEENVNPIEEVSDTQNEINIDDDGDYLSSGDRLIDNIMVERIKDEIMETAAGFAPIPLFRKRQKAPPRRRFAIRRQFQRYPYSAYRRVPFYYPYYTFYRPSSLRFY